MKLVWQTYRYDIGPVAEAAVEELCDRLRALHGAPVRMIVLKPGTARPVDAWVVCRDKHSLTWLWLTYDCMGDDFRAALRLVPFTIRDAYRDCRIRDLMCEHLGWKPRPRAKRRP